ncbi:flagellar motor protein [Thermodesulfovibrionales bacterium]|nr:flagellar motor protein [Thermodesulfovibrionales bacterium]MCL0034131.1 flagellar motor protein [Thermodesulfovibrionales bacterium]MCL0050176.1 flagellar motor protein [Thermodesulfovibrionales bacterium]MCL0051258.1 flagellar motor protein [Thermodesulfovibrionales bacterium]MCL0068331.1 flagellar motor protein [Thermodesulfovibrionales bacterium]
MSIAAFLGLIIGVSAVVVGSIAKGGGIAHLAQLAAAVIVFGGTFGATLLSFSARDVIAAVKSLDMVFGKRRYSPLEIAEDIIDILIKARKGGLLILEPTIKNIEEPFLRRGLTHVIDGMPPAMIREVLYKEIDTYEENMKSAAKVFDAAGGYAPALGLIGAILGLILVMRDIAYPEKIGAGIALAFVATIYGIGSAYLLFFPMGKKIMSRLKEEIFVRELIVEGVLGVEKGMNPHFLKARLNAFLAEKGKLR